MAITIPDNVINGLVENIILCNGASVLDLKGKMYNFRGYIPQRNPELCVNQINLYYDIELSPLLRC